MIPRICWRDFRNSKRTYIVVDWDQGRLKIRTLQLPSKNSINSVEYIKGKR